jgi:hypothetical protein
MILIWYSDVATDIFHQFHIPVPSQGHYGFPVIDWFCLFIWVLTFPLEDCSEFGNFVITLIHRYIE